MPTRFEQIDRDIFLTKPISDSDDVPEPLRIKKLQNSKSSDISRPSLTFKASFDSPLPYHGDRNVNNYIYPYEPRAPRARYSVDPRPKSSGEDQIIDAKFRVEPPSREIYLAPELKVGSNEKQDTNLSERKKNTPRQILKLQGLDYSNQNLLPEMIKKQNPDLESQCKNYARTNTFKNYEDSGFQEPITSRIERNNLYAQNLSRMDRVNSAVSISTVLAFRGSPPPDELSINSRQRLSHEFNVRDTATGVSGSANSNNHQNHRLDRSKFPHVLQYPEVVRENLSNSRPDFSINNRQRVKNITGPPSITRNVSGSQAIGQEFQQMQISSSPPPAYSSVKLEVIEDIQAESNHKQNGVMTAVNTAPKQLVTGSPNSTRLHDTRHPAFANEPRRDTQTTQPASQVQQYLNPSSFESEGPLSPPLLPEGWISHLDQNSGQYYYIHLPTQATQWEFPNGPTPSYHIPASLSPGLSSYTNPHLSPGFSPRKFGHAENIMSIASQAQTPTGFIGSPPSAGIELFKVVPTNGVYFGPYLRYINIDLQKAIWFGSIMLVTDAPQPPTIHIHQTVDLSPNPKQLKPNSIFVHQRWTFYRYDLELLMGDGQSEKWTYAITSHLGCTRYEFLVASRNEKNWRFIAHSGNDFAVNTSINDRSKLGGIGLMWKDVLQKNLDCGGFHVQLGLGDQIYGDRLWKEIPSLKQWVAISGKENRKNATWTARHEEDISHAYFHYYTSHFDQPYLREAFAQIPHVLQIDDHDIFDGFGSYPDHMQFSNIFENIGRIGIEMYLLFQHHTTKDILRKATNDIDLFTITGCGWHFLKYLGPAVVVIGPDCRSERNQRQILAGPTYQGLFPKVANLPSSVQHCIWMIPVPVIFPRLDTMESIAHTITTAKKGVTGTYNLLGKMTSSVAGVVGGKQAVASGFSQVKKAVGKSGLMGGVLNTFGDVDIADELRDMWTHESKDLERTYLIRTLQGIAHHKGVRITFLSGDVNCSGVGLVHDPCHLLNHKTMYQVISSAIVAAPPPHYLLRMLHNNKVLYVPANGQRSNNAVSDTKEDMMEIFQTEVNGAPRDLKKLMGRRNYVTFMVYNPEDVVGTNHGSNSAAGGQQKPTQLSLAVNFIVQNEGSLAAPIKYGPVVIPGLEYGR